MIDYQRIVEFLRDFRAVPGQSITDEVRRAATEYAQLCSQANERLRQCTVFLQQGLRSEAIHLANETPNLLELVAALDLPESAAWAEFCLHNDLPGAPPLQMDRAAQLNEAYGQEEPLEGLLRRHRRLALAHAPIKDRLETMRQIRAIDASSNFWEKDIRDFEVARMRELRFAFAAALERHDAQAVTDLSAEILQSPWLEPVSNDLLNAAQGAEERLRLMATDANLRSLLATLRSAYAAREHGRCASLVHQIRKLLADNNQGVSNEVAAELKPIMAWIAQEDELATRHHAVTQAQKLFTDALAADAANTTLESLRQKLVDLGEPIPPDMEDRYQQKLRQRIRATQRKYRMALATVAGIVILALVGGYLYFQSDLAAGWARRIHEANANRDLATAQQLIQEQERRAPEFTSSPNVVTAKQETQKLLQQFELDRQNCQSLLSALSQEQQRAAKDLAAVSTLSITDLLTSAGQVEQKSAQETLAKSLTWVDPEGKIPELIKTLRQQATQLRDAADAKAITQAQAIDQRLDAITGDGSITSAGPALDAIGADIAALRRYTNLGQDALAKINALGAKLAQKNDAVTKGLNEAQQLVALRRRATSVDTWQKELSAFIAKFPDSPSSREFARAIELMKNDASIEALHQLEEAWAGQFDATSEAIARARLDELKNYLTANPRSPYRPAIEQYTAYLTQEADALSVKSTWQQGFRELLATPLMADLKYIAVSDGTRYYVMGDIKQKSTSLNDRVSITFEAIDPANLTKRKSITVAPPLSLVTAKPQPVAHAKFVEIINAQLKQINADNWDTVGVQIIDLLAKDKEMDPVVRAILLQQAMQTTIQISGWGLGGLYDQTLRDLARQEVENIVWYDFAKPVPKPTLDALQRIIDTLPRTETVLQTIRDNRARLFKTVSCSFTTTGALMRDSAGNWTIYPVGTVDDGSLILTAGALPKSENLPAPLLRVARYANSKFTLENSARDLPEGTFLFIGK